MQAAKDSILSDVTVDQEGDKFIFRLTLKPEYLRQYTLQAYQAQAARTAMARTARVYTDLVGLVAEVGELMDEYQHAEEQQREINLTHVREEVGDCLWRLADLCSAYDWSLAEVAHENIKKLERRHPEGFSAETSKARLDKIDEVKHEL